MLESKYLYSDGISIYYVQRVNSVKQKYQAVKEIPTSPLSTKITPVNNKRFKTAEDAQGWLDLYAKEEGLEPCPQC